MDAEGEGNVSDRDIRRFNDRELRRRQRVTWLDRLSAGAFCFIVLWVLWLIYGPRG